MSDVNHGHDPRGLSPQAARPAAAQAGSPVGSAPAPGALRAALLQARREGARWPELGAALGLDAQQMRTIAGCMPRFGRRPDGGRRLGQGAGRSPKGECQDHDPAVRTDSHQGCGGHGQGCGGHGQGCGGHGQGCGGHGQGCGGHGQGCGGHGQG